MKLPWNKRKKRILFVCLANICRSPLAENLLEDALKKHHLHRQVSVDSAAIENWGVGRPMDKTLQSFLSEDDIAIKKHRCRPLTEKDGERFDYIIAFDTLTLNASKLRVGETNASKVSLFSSYQENPEQSTIVDPIETRDFKQCYHDIKEGIPDIITEIEKVLKT